MDDYLNMRVIVTAPSLDPSQNVSGVSSVVSFIIDKNKRCEYLHFQLGKSDKEKGLWNRVARIAFSYKAWKKMLAENSDALIHYSFPLSAPSILRDPVFMYHAIRKHRKMVIHVHGGLFLTAPKIPFVLNRILKWVFSWNVPFIVLSEGEKDILQESFGAKRVHVLPNCPDLPGDVNTEGTKGTKGSIDNRTIVLGYLGRIEPNKGMTELLKACQQLKKNGVNFKLRFAGKEQMEGEYLPIYREVLGDSFEYVGLVSGDTKDAFLRSLDVFVMPTYFEGLPMSLLECMGYGVVPVITNVGSVGTVVNSVKRDLLRGDENGVFVEIKDVDSIVEAVTWLCRDRDLLGQLSCNARKTIMENFSAQKYVETLNEIYGREYLT